jgi:hypothetical protein
MLSYPRQLEEKLLQKILAGVFSKNELGIEVAEAAAVAAAVAVAAVAT